MSTTLTDRYVAATVRRVPEKQRQDIERELRAAIADDIDARVQLGEQPDHAEFAALRELGAPDRLATSYANRSLGLIGPDSYPDYLHALRGLCWVVLPIVYVVLVVVSRAHGDNVWRSIFSPLGTTLTVAVYLAVFVTLGFAAADRARAAHTSAEPGPWSPDALTAVPEREPAGVGELITQLVLAVIFVAAVFVQRFVSPVHNAAGAVPILAPELWHLWVPYFGLVFVLAIGLAVVNLVLKVRARQQAAFSPVVRTVLVAAAAVPLIILFLQARVLNHALTGDAGALVTPGSWVGWLASIVILVISAGILADTWRTKK